MTLGRDDGVAQGWFNMWLRMMGPEGWFPGWLRAKVRSRQQPPLLWSIHAGG